MKFERPPPAEPVVHPDPPVFKSLGTYTVKGREGIIHIVELDRDVESGYPPFAGKDVIIDGVLCACRGVEAFATPGHYKGEKIGLLVVPKEGA